MTDWLEQYTSALAARDVREQAHKPYIDAYTRLANKTHSSTAPPETTQPEQSPSPGTNTPTPGKIPAKDASTTPNDTLTGLRADLSSTQKARAALAASLRDVEIQLSALRTEHKQATEQATALTKARLDAERKLRDRDEELRGKDELVERAHDEMVALGLQLNMSEAKAEKLGHENRELVDRWMKRMGEEAERVNRDSKWA